MVKVAASSPIDIIEDVHNEFRMHYRLLITEIAKSQNKQDKDGSIRRSAQPISKTVCSFLNTDGGRIFLGIDDDRNIKGILMSRNMIDHFFGTIRMMCESFKPFNPINRIKVSILEVSEIDGEDSKVGLKRANLARNRKDGINELKSHDIGGTYCDCFHEMSLVPSKRYLIIIHVQAPDPNARTVIFQNEEGLAYRRRLASNKCVYIDDLRRIMIEKNRVFVDLHDEVRFEIDRFKLH